MEAVVAATAAAATRRIDATVEALSDALVAAATRRAVGDSAVHVGVHLQVDVVLVAAELCGCLLVVRWEREEVVGEVARGVATVVDRNVEGRIDTGLGVLVVREA